ncbi:MAG TPA: heparan-alpha-glucosaminide N-acetyltransferase [Methanocorpusculum sp.]|nr:heparan-alpha-glucosaminide N-acetyltransferase [Methanocorpusculum sp.]
MATQNPTRPRYWEIDAVRGISLIGMILFHTVFVLGIFSIINVSVWDWVCSFLWLGTSIFVIISGVSLVLRHGRMEGSPRKAYYLAIVKRGVQVLLIGMAIALICSLFIYFFIQDGRYMFFNFLQMMGWSMIICIPFLKLGKWNFIPAIIFILLGLFLNTITGPPWLMPFGITPEIMPRDWFPLLPWTGIMLLGAALGSVFYPKGVRRFSFPDAGRIGRVFAKIGRYPLQIYIIHLPALILVIGLVVIITSALGCPVGSIPGF